VPVSDRVRGTIYILNKCDEINFGIFEATFVQLCMGSIINPESWQSTVKFRKEPAMRLLALDLIWIPSKVTSVRTKGMAGLNAA